MNKKTATSFLIIAILFVSAFAGTIVYFNSKIASLNSQITNQNSEIENLNNQISNLTAQVTNLTSANIETSLKITDFPPNLRPGLPTAVPYNVLVIAGSANNTGQGTAYNAGLQVVGYGANGTLLINMTAPFVGQYGTDAEINSWLNSPNLTASPLLILYGGHTDNVELAIYHEGTASNWFVTPVWTNSP